MKAVQYFEKYREQIIDTDEKKAVEAIGQLVYDLSMEAKEMIRSRHVKTNSGAVAVILELNQKYNAVCRLFQKNYGTSPLLQNGFLTYWAKQIPELTRYV